MAGKKCVLVDIDGTLADLAHRRHLVENPEDRNWEAFFAPDLVRRDTLITPIAEAVIAVQRAFPVLYVSGRRDDLRDITTKWLRSHGLWWHPFELFMRQTGDHRPDTDVKRELLAVIREQGWEPFLSFDDRSSVVAMWREEGLTCLQVAPGDF